MVERPQKLPPPWEAGPQPQVRIGRRDAHTPIMMIINDLDIRIINPTTGELLRQLTLDPARDYQPQPRT